MVGNNFRGKLVIYTSIIFLTFLALIKILIAGSGDFFRLELIGFIFLVLLTFIGFIGYSQSWGERVLFFVFLFYIINLLGIWCYKGSLFLIPLILSTLGFIMSIPKKKSCNNMINNSKFGTVELNDDFVSDEPREIIFETVGEGGKEFESDYDKSVLIKKDVNISKSTKSKTIKAKHSPGKYVASNRSNIFHEPKCEWAKKIKKDRQVWFSEKRRASNKGYRAHRCVK